MQFDAIIADPPFGRRERTLPTAKAFTRGRGGSGDKGSGETGVVSDASGVTVVPTSMCVGTSTVTAEKLARDAANVTSGRDSIHDISGDANEHILPLFTPATNMGDNNSELITTLLQVSMCRLVVGGRLVLWLPSKADTPPAVVEDYLNSLIAVAGGNAESSGASGSGDDHSADSGDGRKPVLKLQRVTAETLNDSLWRWLCVFRFE